MRQSRNHDHDPAHDVDVHAEVTGVLSTLPAHSWQNLLYSDGGIRFTLRASGPLGAQHRHESDELAQVLQSEGTPAGRGDDERVVGVHARPRRGQRPQAPVSVVEVDAVLAPVAPLRQQIEGLPGQRMERVRDSESSSSTVDTGRI